MYHDLKDNDLRSSSETDDEICHLVTGHPSLQQRRRPWRTCFNIGALSLLFATTALIVSIGLLPRAFQGSYRTLPSEPSRTYNLGSCGKSWQEAKEMGCVYDIMMTNWVRPECYERELSEAYFNYANWTFYRDSEGTQVIPQEEIREGRYVDYYVHGQYHFSHCSYILNKILRQIGKGPKMVLDSDSRSWGHSLHCTHMLMAANTTYINGKSSSHALLGTNSIDCIVGEWTPFESIPDAWKHGTGVVERN